jgi:hypothetical protein
MHKRQKELRKNTWSIVTVSSWCCDFAEVLLPATHNGKGVEQKEIFHLANHKTARV